MKKRWILLLYIILVAYQSYAQSSVGVGLQIRDTFGPEINLISPINNSGNTHGNFTFSYNASDANNIDNCSLIINNNINLTNKTIAKIPAINSLNLTDLPVGSYNWSINCTDSLNNSAISEKRVFTVILGTNFNGTNLSAVDLRNVTNFVVETSGFGKINFSEGIDLSQGFDLNNYINLSFNKIELNSTALSALNKSATLQIVNITFSNPRVLRDGAVCPESVCKKISYTGGVLTFNISHWTAYSSEETPAASSDTGGGASGGGGGSSSGGGGGGGPPAIQIVTDFSVDKTALKVVLKQGQTKTETLTVKNTGTTIFDVKTILSDISKFKILPEEHEIRTTLQPNEEKTIELIFKALENERPDIYPAKIVLQSPSTKKEIDTIIEVDSADPLFDVDVEVLSETKKIFPGEELLLEVNLFNVRGFGRVDVSIEYAIKDFKGNVVATEHETLAVETQAKFTRSLLVPSGLRPGSYVALVKVVYGDSIGTSSDIFEVRAKSIKLYPIEIKNYGVILFGAIAILLAAVIIFSAYKAGYLKKMPKEKAEEIKELQEEEKAQKLKKELEALEQAHKSGFISEESYQRDKKRIEEKLKS